MVSRLGVRIAHRSTKAARGHVTRKALWVTLLLAVVCTFIAVVHYSSSRPPPWLEPPSQLQQEGRVPAGGREQRPDADRASSKSNESNDPKIEHAVQPDCPPPVERLESALPFQQSRYRTSFEQECYEKFSYGLLENWVTQRQEWCSGGGEAPSSLHCYPLHLPHKKAGTVELFCEARHFFMDFSKIRGSPKSNDEKKVRKGSTLYLDFDAGSTFATCTKTSLWQDGSFMNHQKLQMRGFTPDTTPPREGTYTRVEEPTYLLARDEDCENSFHSTADFINVFMVTRMLDLDTENLQVVLWDKHANNPFYELIQQTFSPNYPLKRASDYSAKTVLFERLIFHLESPASLIFPGLQDPLKCRNSELYTAYRRHVLSAFNLLDVPPPPVPQVVLILRKRTPNKNVGRILKNEKEVVGVLKSGTLIDVKVVDLAEMSMREQLALLRSTSVLVGIHGAGLMNIMFAAEEAVLVEIHPPYRLNRHFRVAARLNGKIYMPMRGTNRDEITCQGSSDEIVVPIREFKETMDGAVRIARSFDDGHSECGLLCESPILALDRGNDHHYKRLGAAKSTPLNTRFPCS